jgi:hypothetical protein
VIGEAIASPMRWPSKWIPPFASANKATLSARARERPRRVLTERPRHTRDLFEVGSRRRIGAGDQSDGQGGDDRVGPRRGTATQTATPSTVAVSVDIAAPHPCVASPPALNAR